MSSKVTILDIPVDNRTSSDIVEVLREWLSRRSGQLRHIVTVNPEFIMMARANPAFAAVLQRADLSTADGIGIILAARLQGVQLAGRLTGVDLTELLASIRAPSPSLFLLGAAEGVAEEAGKRLQHRHPDVIIAGSWSGSPQESDLAEIVARITETGADTLLVAFGAPEQDLWIQRHNQCLAGCGIVIAIGVGGTFDYLSGRVPRAPRLIRRIGFEWLYRLIRQPWRWRRQLALPKFVALVIWERISGKGRASVDDHGSTEH
jgi:N-acetylglucosaminyldiphosphoundecaprenol N-acetyl-beta-D-mannosaminyltransferase